MFTCLAADKRVKSRPRAEGSTQATRQISTRVASVPLYFQSKYFLYKVANLSQVKVEKNKKHM